MQLLAKVCVLLLQLAAQTRNKFSHTISRTLVLGAPARVKRPLTEAEVAHLRTSAERYAALAAAYRAEGW
jgi:carbonic anhydrase/acetyltransferase-like protein (isoleucine patch superfamily)